MPEIPKSKSYIWKDLYNIEPPLRRGNLILLGEMDQTLNHYAAVRLEIIYGDLIYLSPEAEKYYQEKIEDVLTEFIPYITDR